MTGMEWIFSSHIALILACHLHCVSSSLMALSNCPGSRLMLSSGIFRVVKNPTSELLVRLQSKNGWFLKISGKGMVSGTTDKESKATIFKLQTLSPSIKRLQSLKTQHFIGINRRGNVYATKDASKETLFRECLEMNFYTTFASAVYESPNHEWYLGIRSTGKVKKASGSTFGRNSVLFQVIQLSRKAERKLKRKPRPRHKGKAAPNSLHF